ncbi:type II secretion system F family protein [Pseudoxanthomonas sp. GM95]|uniref:type II secretion system F family protein n=1 Tax=Pseudoxanthomonas sp. GM95 TaxID=1881043 RepID=UPI000B855707|nr:type II secretion system F family protein [Pseudoxanthomonas sp. GM95]
MLLAAAILIFAIALLLLGSDLWTRARLDNRRDQALERAFGNAQPQDAPEQTGGVRSQLLEQLASLGRRFEGSRVRDWLLADEDRLLLDQVGWNNSSGTAVFLGLRLLLALLLPLAVLALGDLQGIKAFVVPLAALAAGVLLPKFALRSWARHLCKQASDELPLLIDLLRLLQGVGFSVDQSLQMLGEKLRPALPVLGRELADANAAYSLGRARAQSLHRLAESFGDKDLRSLVQLMVQVHQHGGAVQEPLRQFSLRLREQRRMEMKEKVGKLSVKMTVVMMFTLLPALLMVLAGPALIALGSTIARMAQ